MSTDELDELIEQLKEVRLQERKLQDKAESILQRITSVRARSQRAIRSTTANQDIGLSVGDYILITNKITTPPGRDANIDDRKGVINRIELPWVYFTTNNGFETKRYAKNLKKIQN